MDGLIVEVDLMNTVHKVICKHSSEVVVSVFHVCKESDN